MPAGTGTPYERVEAWCPRRERDVPRGCPGGRLTRDPDVIADEEPRAAVAEALGRPRGRPAGIVEQGGQVEQDS
ncbi:hypothetical protein [Streptomyces sp. NPDC058108]|uniref:hypothetical protein n=1 Tax=Streptomyces sp. NPDC058108 TaxID=3346344 RepID=UPI0036EF863E